MTHHHSSNHQADFYHVIQHLKEKGVRITSTRKAVVAYIIESDDHPSAEMIYQDLLPDYPGMSLATVYNNLKLLWEEGFVTEIKRTNDNTTYYDFMGHDHLNIICEVCGKITDFMDIELPSLKKEAQDQTGYKVTKEVLAIYGICPDCQSNIE
ncbi:TPA: transcriptional repressor [Streptococcus suis]|uniref:Fur family transcriptional regulator n=1 Tax=Streptococcus suis TaxID=1307 RepID=UPI001554FF4D|nr:transcriptional repressor [Streptococcus suis]MDY7594994.1 Fur family transcriptional regulator [Streptococcus suis]NQQ28691.1 transcriptional repressor [Streptococcus suis]HEL2253937.1 transcriptional repressor [Streptococcus suis]HEL2264664.1 transcriptional repressor [Streptococcus suis]HEL2298440.1 transcriptional repressor [Streptococcus suis]